jgi:hypothetical protein
MTVMLLRPLAVMVAIGALTLAACSAAPAGPANDPVTAVRNFVALMEAKQFDQMQAAACSELAGEMDLGSGFSAGLPGVTATQFLEAVTIQVREPQYAEVSRSADRAVVSIKGTMAMTFDRARMREILRPALEAQGKPADDAALDAWLDLMEGMMNQPLDEQVDVVNEGGEWKVCSELGSL